LTFPTHSGSIGGTWEGHYAPTHKNWWQCTTATAYLISDDLAGTSALELGPSGWRTARMTKIHDLGDPGTTECCVTNGAQRRRKVAIQANNVETDERGLVYLGDQANTGLHIARLTGDAARIAGGN